MIDTDSLAHAVPASVDLSDLAELVRTAAAATAVLWRASGLDGDLTVRLVEVSHALQRASLALADAVRIGGSARDEGGCIASRPASAELIVHGALPRDEIAALLDDQLRVIFELGLRLRSPEDADLRARVSGAFDRLEELTARGRRAMRTP